MGLHHDILSDPVSVLELRQAIAVDRETTVRCAADLMRQKGLGSVVVVNDENSPIGKFTERLLLKLLLEKPEGLDDPLGQHMYTESTSVKTSDPIAKLIECMDVEKLRYVIVIDEQGHPVGLAGQKSLMEYIVDHFPRQVKVQETATKLHMDQREGA